jgi:hypothetical protein
MRRTFILLLLVSVPVFAQSPDRWRASVFRLQHGGYAAALAYAPMPAWDVEAAVGEQSDQWLSTITFVPPTGGPTLPVTVIHRFTAHPVDLLVTRHFATGLRVSPYVRAGARYVEGRGPSVETVFVNGLPLTRPAFEHRTSAQVGAGASVRLTPRTALRVEVARLLRSDDVSYDPLRRAAAGVSWNF